MGFVTARAALAIVRVELCAWEASNKETTEKTRAKIRAKIRAKVQGKYKEMTAKIRANSLEENGINCVFKSINHLKTIHKNLPDYMFRFSPNFAEASARIILHITRKRMLFQV